MTALPRRTLSALSTGLDEDVPQARKVGRCEVDVRHPAFSYGSQCPACRALAERAASAKVARETLVHELDTIRRERESSKERRRQARIANLAHQLERSELRVAWLRGELAKLGWVAR